jgi:hypothetical protein
VERKSLVFSERNKGQGAFANYVRFDCVARKQQYELQINVLISPRLQTSFGEPTRKIMEEIDPGVAVGVLEENFASQDPDEAAETVLKCLCRASNSLGDNAMNGHRPEVEGRGRED